VRRKRVELEQAVISAARNMTRGGWASERQWEFRFALMTACEKLDSYELDANIDADGKWVRGAPETSEQAARAIKPRVGSVRRSIIDQIRIAAFCDRSGLTDDELERKLRRPHTTISSARNALCQGGWLYDAGYRRKTVAGRDAVVWVLTPAADEPF